MEAINFLNSEKRIERFSDRSLSFLVVEDDITLRPLIEYILYKVHAKATILWAYTEDEAELAIKDKMSRGERFDFVLADIFLSGPRTGVDLWHKYAQSTSQFILMSSIAPAKLDQLLLKNVGLNKQNMPIYLQKPFRPDDCIETLRTLACILL